ncbi:MAG: WD40 repeat domain-containing protein, partial [Planctomycetota bacterium]
VREQEALKLSTVNTALRGDVETIVAKSLEKDRDRRYQTALELTKDIENYLRDEPISARPPSLTYQVRVFARRNKALMTGVGAVFAALLLGLSGMSYLYVDTDRARRDAETARASEAEQREIADEQKEAALLSEQRAQAARASAEAATQRVSEQSEELNRALYFSEMFKAGAANNQLAGGGKVDTLTDAWRPQPGEEDLRGWEWYYLRSTRNPGVTTYDIPNTGRAYWGEDGVYFIEVDQDNRTVFRNADTLQLTGVNPGIQFGSNLGRALAHGISPDGTKRLENQNGDLMVVDSKTGQVDRTLGTVNRYSNNSMWSPDGHRVAIIGRGNPKITLVNASTGHPQLTLAASDLFADKIAWSPNGSRLVATYQNPMKPMTLRVWDTATGEDITPPNLDIRQDQPIDTIEWSPDGSRVATSHRKDYLIRIWDPITGATQHVMAGHTNKVNAMAWTKDGRRLATSGDDYSVKLWDTQTGQIISTFRGHRREVRSIQWNPAETQLLSSSRVRTKIWDVNNRALDAELQLGHDTRVSQVAWSPDGNRFASAGSDGTIRLWDANRHTELTRLEGGHGILTSLSWSPDGTRIATGDLSGSGYVWDLNTREVIDQWTDPDSDPGPTYVEWKPDGVRLAYSANNAGIRIRNTATGRVTPVADIPIGRAKIAWSPRGNRLAVAGVLPGAVQVYDVETGQLLQSLKWSGGSGVGLTWSPDGSRLVLAVSATVLHIWDVESEELLHTLNGHFSGVNAVSWSPDGQRIASGSSDKNVMLWDAESGEHILTLAGHTQAINSVEWSPDGRRLISADDVGEIKIWESRAGYAEEEAILASQPEAAANRESEP